MRAYGSPPDDQMQLELPGCTSAGEELMADARKWAGIHYDEFQWYKSFARSECRNGGKASPNFCLQSMRRHFRCEVPNAYAPALARIAMEQDKSIRFRLAKSKVDGFCGVALK